MRCLVVSLVVSLLLLVASPLLAQQDMGVITGVLTDKTGAVIPEANVVVTNRDTGETTNASSSAAGTFTAGPLRVGVYDVQVTKPGFRQVVSRGVEVHAQDRVRADFQLEVGQTSESISVVAEAPLLASETSSIAQVIDEREIRQLPLNSRNFQQLAWLAPGVAPDTRGRDQDSGFVAHGQPFTQNSFIVDGIDNNNNVMGMQDRKMQVIVPSLDAVAEFKVETSNYSAEFGRNSGAVMLINIKSGSNRFHGTAYEYVRNDAFDARATFNYVDRTGDGKADPEKLRKNLFGATIGGPVRRDRTFFFFSWEQLQQRQGQADLVIVPTAAERAGIFDPAVSRVRDPLTGAQFPNNSIPVSRFDPVSAKLLSLWPLPNSAGTGTRQNYSNNPPWSTERNQYDMRVDHNISNADKIFGRFSINRFNVTKAGVFDIPARGGQSNDRAIDANKAYSGALSYTRIFTPTLLNEFRYGFIRQLVDKRELDTALLSDLTSQYGILGVPGNPQLFGLPQIQLTGTASYIGLGESGSVPNFKIAQIHQFLDNVSWNRGKHNFKFGADLRWNRSDILGGNTSHGTFTFDGTFTTNSFADFLLGNVGSANLSTALIGQMRFQNYMFYALDDWKVTPRLTLNLGLRYELTTPWYDKHNHMTTLDLGAGSSFGQIVSAGNCDSSWSCRGLVNTDTNNFAPRVGFAWQLNGKSVVRGGAGYFYGGQGALGADQRMINNFPFVRSATLTSTATTPAIRFSSGIPLGLLDAITVPPDNSNWAVWTRNLPEPLVYQWNLSIQRELWRNLALTAAYVGSSSTKLLDSYNINGALPGPPATERQRRLLPQWNTITYYAPFGHSSYEGLDLQLERRFASGFSATAAFTWGHSIDNITEQFGATGIGGIQDYRNFDASRGDSSYDVRRRFASSFVWQLPFGKGRRWMQRGGVMDAVLGGWQLSSVLSLQSGYPFSITVPNARTLLGASGIGTWRPDVVGDPSVDDPTTNRWFNTAAFALPRAADGTYHYGNLGRGTLRTQGLRNVDAGLMKNFRLTEQVTLQFRGEAFNLTNTPQYGTPNTTLGAADFGTIRTTDNLPRQLQFALRLSF